MGRRVEKYGSGRSLAVGRVRVSADDPIWRGINETAAATMMSFQRSAFEVVPHGRGGPIVVCPGSVTVTRRPMAYFRRPIDDRGEVTDWLWLEPELAARLLHGSPPVASRWSLPGPLLLRQRRAFARARAGFDLAVQSEMVSVAADVCRALGGDGGEDERFSASGRTARDRVAIAMEHLATDVRGELSLDELSDAMELSPAHACVVFRRVTGMTLGEASRGMRLALALDRVLEGGAPMTRLAVEFGFSSPSHFTSRFRSCFGVTPTRARRLVCGVDRGPGASG